MLFKIDAKLGRNEGGCNRQKSVKTEDRKYSKVSIAQPNSILDMERKSRKVGQTRCILLWKTPCNGFGLLTNDDGNIPDKEETDRRMLCYFWKIRIRKEPQRRLDCYISCLRLRSEDAREDILYCTEDFGGRVFLKKQKVEPRSNGGVRSFFCCMRIWKRDRRSGIFYLRTRFSRTGFIGKRNAEQFSARSIRSTSFCAQLLSQDKRPGIF